MLQRVDQSEYCNWADFPVTIKKSSTFHRLWSEVKKNNETHKRTPIMISNCLSEWNLVWKNQG